MGLQRTNKIAAMVCAWRLSMKYTKFRALQESRVGLHERIRLPREIIAAQRGSVLWLILKESLVLVLAGVLIGVPTVFAAGKWISSLLFAVKAADPLAIALGVILMFLVGVVACYVPVLRAMRVDPMVALRYE